MYIHTPEECIHNMCICVCMEIHTHTYSYPHTEQSLHFSVFKKKKTNEIYFLSHKL